MKTRKTRRPYQPLNREAIRADVQGELIEFARGVLFAYDERKSEMSKEEYRLRVRYGYMELRRLAKLYGFDLSYFTVPELKEIPC